MTQKERGIVRIVFSVFVALVLWVALSPIVGEIEAWGTKVLATLGVIVPIYSLAQLGISGLLLLLEKRFEQIEE